MDFEPTDEQRALCEAIRRFGRTLNDGLAGREASGEFDRDGWNRCAEFGIQGLSVASELGGSGHDFLTSVLAMEALGNGCKDNGLVFSLNAQSWAFAAPLVRFGTAAQRERFLPRLCAGELIGAHAITEPGAGSDALALSTRAVRDGDAYVLDGTKSFITNGPVADVLLVFATVDPSAKMAGITGFLVERGTPGLTLSAPVKKMGLRTSPLGEAVLDGCRIPVANRLAAEGAGAAIFGSSMEAERACIFASHLGSMERLLGETIAYARSRRQFGAAIGSFSPVADKLVATRVALEAGRLLLYRAAARRSSGRDGTLDSAIAKLFVSEAHVRQALDAIQIHGGYGFTTEYEIERELRDAIPGTIYSGTSEMQRKIIARLMGL